MVGMQRDIHKMEVKRNKRALQNIRRNGIFTLSNSQIFLISPGKGRGRKQGLVNLLLTFCFSDLKY